LISYTMASSKPTLLDRIRGMLEGHLLGDAVGAPYERSGNRGLSAYTGVVREPIVRNSRWQGRRVSVVGQATDDHEMLIALMHAIRYGGGYDSKIAAEHYMALATVAKNPFLGRNTRNLFKGVKTYKGYLARRTKHIVRTAVADLSQSNGALMRAAVLAALPTPIASDRAAFEDAKLSNPHPVTVDANRVYVRALRVLLEGGDPVDVQIAAPGWCVTVAVRGVLDHARGSGARDVTGKSKGWVLHGLWCAFRSLSQLARGGSFQDTLDWVIRLGGDTDTNGAIAGAMAGAVVGYPRMATESRTGQNLATVHAADTTGGSFPRPATYGVNSHSANARTLASRFVPTRGCMPHLYRAQGIWAFRPGTLALGTTGADSAAQRRTLSGPENVNR